MKLIEFLVLLQYFELEWYFRGGGGGKLSPEQEWLIEPVSSTMSILIFYI